MQHKSPSACYQKISQSRKFSENFAVDVWRTCGISGKSVLPETRSVCVRENNLTANCNATIGFCESVKYFWEWMNWFWILHEAFKKRKIVLVCYPCTNQKSLPLAMSTSANLEPEITLMMRWKCRNDDLYQTTVALHRRLLVVACTLVLHFFESSTYLLNFVAWIAAFRNQHISRQVKWQRHLTNATVVLCSATVPRRDEAVQRQQVPLIKFVIWLHGLGRTKQGI